MTDNRLKTALAAVEELKRRYARENLIDFATATFDRYEPNWHHYLMADRLEMLSRGDIFRLMINMPPRHGKSEISSIRFPAWYLGNNSHHKIIAASYSASLAADFGKRARNVVSSLEFRRIFPEAVLSEESAAKLDWNLERTFSNEPCPKCGNTNWHKKAFGRAVCRSCGSLGEFPGSNTIGEYHGAGVGGGITGKGANILIIDDPIKNRKDAQSTTIRANLQSWYCSDAFTRLEKEAKICICQTRWHEDDLSGMILSKNYTIDGHEEEKEEQWHVLSLPAIAEEDEEWKIYNPRYQAALNTDTVYRSKGDPLWADKYKLNRLQQIRRTMTEYEWASLFQQRPQPDGGGMFAQKNFRYCSLSNGYYQLFDGKDTKTVAVKDCTRFTTCDLGITGADDSDYTVISTWDLTKDSDLILHHVDRQQIMGAYHIDLLWQNYRAFHPLLLMIESTAYQATLVQTAVLNGLPAKKLKADGDKKTRALPAAAKIENHKVFFLDSIPDLRDLEKELVSFPNGKHKDFVDTVAYAVIASTDLYTPEYTRPTATSTNRQSRIKMYQDF